MLVFLPKKASQNAEQNLSNPINSVAPIPDRATVVAISEAAKTAPPEQARPELVSFFKKESSEMDLKKENTVEAEERAEAQAGLMNASDISFVKKNVLSANSSANEKIFGVFLLGKAAGKSVSALSDIIRTPYSSRPNPAPHTVEETKAMQEKAIVYMAVDALAAQAKDGDASALEELRRLANEAPDPGVRNYVLGKIAELSA